jgi:flavin-dependent dehydrogenase
MGLRPLTRNTSKSWFADVGIVGGGPAGSRVAELLASRGIDVVVWDPKAPWEKPCGGGLTDGLVEAVPEVREVLPRARAIAHAVLAAGDVLVPVRLDRAMYIIARRELGEWQLARARAAGAAIEAIGVRGLARIDGGWAVTLRNGVVRRVRHLVGADGAASLVRAVAAPALRIGLEPTRVAYPAAGVAPADVITLKFSPGLEGYSWDFPRPGHHSVGAVVGPRAGTRERLDAEVGSLLAAHTSPACEPKKSIKKDNFFHGSPARDSSRESTQDNSSLLADRGSSELTHGDSSLLADRGLRELTHSDSSLLADNDSRESAHGDSSLLADNGSRESTHTDSSLPADHVSRESTHGDSSTIAGRGSRESAHKASLLHASDRFPARHPVEAFGDRDSLVRVGAVIGSAIYPLRGGIGGADFALVGDAAGLADPATGEGITNAFRSGALAAEVFAADGSFARYGRVAAGTFEPEFRAARWLRRLMYDRGWAVALIQAASRRARMAGIAERMMNDTNEHRSRAAMIVRLALAVLRTPRLGRDFLASGLVE